MLPLLLLSLTFAGDRPLNPTPAEGNDKAKEAPAPIRRLTVEATSGLSPHAQQQVQRYAHAFEGCVRAATGSEPRGRWHLEVRQAADGGSPTGALVKSRSPPTPAQSCALWVAIDQLRLTAASLTQPGRITLLYASTEPETPTSVELDAAREEARAAALEASCLATAAKHLQQVVASIRATIGGDRRAMEERLAQARGGLAACGKLLRPDPVPGASGGVPSDRRGLLQ